MLAFVIRRLAWAVMLAFLITFRLREVPLRETAHLRIDVEGAETEAVGAGAVLLAEAAEA